MKKTPDPLYWQKLREKSVKKWKENYQPKPINKRSKKRAKEEAEYSKMRKKALPEHEYVECEARLEGCTGRATEWHHTEGRIGKRLTDKNKKKLVCHNCHEKITVMPIEQAIELGLSERRNVSISERKSRLNNE